MKATVRRLDPQIIVYLAKQNKGQGKSRSAKCRTRFMQWPVAQQLKNKMNETITKNLVRLNPEQGDLYRLAEGRLVYIDHPEKGIVYADNRNVFINTIELTEEEKSRLG